jgi:hypothetical protein
MSRALLNHRAVFNTGTTSGAQIHLDTAGALFDCNLEITGAARDAFKVCISDQFDVQVPADLDQYGGNDSHRTVIGGEGFVQLGHYPANGRGFLEEIDIIP